MFTILVVGEISPQAGMSQLEGCKVLTARDLKAAANRLKEARADLLIVSLAEAVPPGEVEDFLSRGAFQGCRALVFAPPQSSAVALDPSLLKAEAVEVIGQVESLQSRLRDWLDCRRRIQRLEEQVEQMQQQRQRRESLMQKLVHDMKGPLTVMLIELGMLERWWEKGRAERFQNGVFRLTQNCEELIEMIQNLLDINRIQQEGLQIRYVTLGLASVLREVLDNPPSILKKREIQIELDLRDTESPLSLDPSMINRALATLLAVSARLCPPKGCILLSCGQCRGQMQIQIECQGRSIESKDCQALLDQYAHEQWRALGLDAGSGIGLNFTRLLIEAHQGRLAIESPSGRGATFAVELPLASWPQWKGASGSAESKSGRLSSEPTRERFASWGLSKK